MSSPGPTAAFKLIRKYLAIDSPPCHVRTLLRQIILGEEWFRGDEAEERADKWAGTFRSKIQSHLNDPSNLGAVQYLSLNSAAYDHVQGSCFCEPSDPEHVQTAKQNRANTFNIFDFISQLSPTGLEILCKKMLSLFGVTSPHASRVSADGGVDFYGRAPFGTILKPETLPAGVEKQLHIWFVGQAKHYPDGSVSTSEIRELIGLADLARSKIFAGTKDPLHAFNARICDPVFSIIITTGRFSRDSVDLLGKCGVIAMDGLQIGQFLADHAVGLSDFVFDKEVMRAWMAE